VQDDSPVSSPQELSGSSLAKEALLEAKLWALKYIPNLAAAKIIGIKSYWSVCGTLYR
jgi:hypothetical protein